MSQPRGNLAEDVWIFTFALDEFNQHAYDVDGILQFVRKVSGFHSPSHANQAAFDEAVEAIAHATAHLLEHLTTTAPPKDREIERQKARERSALRFGTPA